MRLHESSESGALALAPEVDAQATSASETFTSLNHARLSTVLLIEDQVDLNRALAGRLKAANYRVLSAYDGLEGLRLIREEQPDLVVLDLALPKLHGLKLLHRLRGGPTRDDTPVIVLTGSADAALVEKCTRSGVKRVLLKPVRQRHVVEVIGEVLDYDA